MSTLFSQIKEKELLSLIPIEKEEYEKAKQEQNKEDFISGYYFVKNADHQFPDYYKKVYKDIAEGEIQTYLLYESLKAHRSTKRNLKIITIIIVAYAISTTISAFFIAGQVAKLFAG